MVCDSSSAACCWHPARLRSISSLCGIHVLNGLPCGYPAFRANFGKIERQDKSGMRKLLFQSDDYGLTDSVADGILKGTDQESSAIRACLSTCPAPPGLRRKFVTGRVSASASTSIWSRDSRSAIRQRFLPGESGGAFCAFGSAHAWSRIIGRQGMCLCFEEDPCDFEQTLLKADNQVVVLLN